MSQQKYNKLVGKHVLIIGGSAGIGFGVAEASIESGARVTISSSNPARIDAAVRDLQRSYPDAKIAGYACDLSKPTVEPDLEKLFKKTGAVDHIVFTPGDKLLVKSIHKTSYEDVIGAGQVRFIAPLFVAKVGSKYLGAGPASSITFTSALVADRPFPNVSANSNTFITIATMTESAASQWPVVASYSAAMHGMTRNLALDLKPIRVNSVSPGPIESELFDELPEQKEGVRLMSQKYPTGGMGKPEDIAEAYLWLMKDKNVTGVVVSSNGGAELI